MRTAMALSLLLHLAAAPAQAQFTNVPNVPQFQQAEALVNQYYAALKAGDTARIAGYIDGDFDTRKQDMLRNPDYAGFLRERYRGSSMQVLGYQFLEGERIAVYFEVALRGGERFTERLTVGPKKEVPGTGALVISGAAQPEPGEVPDQLLGRQ